MRICDVCKGETVASFREATVRVTTQRLDSFASITRDVCRECLPEAFAPKPIPEQAS